MAMDNDKKIKELLNAVETKRKELGTKPKADWKTNGVISGTNINTVNSADKLVSLTSSVIVEKTATEEACKLLGFPPTKYLSDLNDALDDMKLRGQIIAWEEEKKKLQAMEKKLKDLRSEDAKTADALSELDALLK